MRFRFTSKLILSLVAVEAVMLGVLVWNSVRLINSGMATSLEQNIGEETLLLANSFAPGLAFQDRAMIDDVLALAQKNPNLVYVAVVNRSGEPMASFGDHSSGDVHHDRDYASALRDGVMDVVKPIVLAGQRLGDLHVGYSIDAARQLAQRTRTQNAAIAAVALLLLVLVTVALGIVLTRGLRRLDAGARALQRGELGYRIAIASKDETGELARTFNQMAARLEQTRDALQREHSALERETKRLSTLLDGIDAVVWEARPGTSHFSYVSKEAESLLGFPVDAWLAPDFLEKHVHPNDWPWVSEVFATKGGRMGSFSLDHRVFDRDGRQIWLRHIVTVDADGDGKLATRGLILDISEQKVSEERIVYLAEHDGLTGLINRRRFQEELERHVAYAQRYSYRGALLFVDLDQFKYINDSYGHQSGDEFLVEVAHLLQKSLRSTDVIGRLGGDEFGVIVPRADEQEAQRVAENLLTTLGQEKVRIGEGYDSHVGASIGIAMYPDHGDGPSELLAAADAAMYVAKDLGRSRFHVFDSQDAVVERIHAKVRWEDRIRRALANDQFVLHYQPVVDLRDGQITHYEALLRMVDDAGGLIPPGAFLDTAEHFGLIRQIDSWVLRTAIARQAASRLEGSPVQIAVNLSGRHFGSTEILELVRGELERHAADPGSIIFEVTETAAVENLATARGFIESLRGLGCRFSLDDFGVGFSSLHYLKNLPVDFVKIDGSFVRNLPSDSADRIFVKAISDLARGLGITTIAEFIESDEVVAVLRELGVHLGQGYHLGAPEPTFASCRKAGRRREALRN